MYSPCREVLMLTEQSPNPGRSVAAVSEHHKPSQTRCDIEIGDAPRPGGPPPNLPVTRFSITTCGDTPSLPDIPVHGETPPSEKMPRK